MFNRTTNLTPIGFDAEAVKFIPTIREVVNEVPCLHTADTKETEPVSKHAKRERERRKLVRGLYLELSRYYRRESGSWKSPELFSRRKDRFI